MLKNIIGFINDGLNNGFRMPIMRSAASKQPSITLMFPYISFVFALLSLAAYHIQVIVGSKSLLVPTSLTVMFFFTCTILYMIRSINKAKIDLNDGKLEISNNEEPIKRNRESVREIKD